MSKIEIRYDGPTDLLEIESEDVTIARGKTGKVSEEMVAYLSDAAWADITVLDGRKPTWPTSHAKLDKFAADAGFDFPSPANGKQSLTVAEKVEALEAAGYSPDGSRNEVTPSDDQHEGESE